MVNRRAFLKLSGLAVAALGSGYAAGRAFPGPSSRGVSLHGFLPEDPAVLSDVMQAFFGAAPHDALHARTVIAADGAARRTLDGVLRAMRPQEAPASSGTLRIRVQRLARPVDADILAGDGRSAVLEPERQFSASYARLRTSLRGREGVLMFSAEYREQHMFDGLFGRGTVVIENERGIFDEIALNGRTRTINVPGPRGITGLRLENGSVHVHTSSCRHALCRQSAPAMQPGDVIACAPNRVLVRIERS